MADTKMNPYFDKEALAFERSGYWASAAIQWQKVAAQHPGSSSWIQKRIEYCQRKSSRITNESYSYLDTYSINQ